MTYGPFAGVSKAVGDSQSESFERHSRGLSRHQLGLQIEIALEALEPLRAVKHYANEYAILHSEYAERLTKNVENAERHLNEMKNEYDAAMRHRKELGLGE